MASLINVHSRLSTARNATACPWRARGVPIPKSVLIQSPRLKALDQQSLQHVLVAAYVGAPLSTGLVQMRARTFQQFPASAEEPFAARAADAPPIRIHRAPFSLLIRPGLAAAIGFTDVGANLQRLQIEHAGPAVVTLVRDELLNDGDLFLGDGCHGFELICGFRQRLLHRARVPLIGILHRNADDRTGLEIDRMLGLVGQMRPAILHLRDLGVGIVR